MTIPILCDRAELVDLVQARLIAALYYEAGVAHLEWRMALARAEERELDGLWECARYCEGRVRALVEAAYAAECAMRGEL